jgi:hypothetical protein
MKDHYNTFEGKRQSRVDQDKFIDDLDAAATVWAWVASAIIISISVYLTWGMS